MHSRRRVPIQRSQIAFARGAWIGVRTIWMPSEVKTASKLTVYLASRSRIKEPKRCLEVHEQVTGLLGHPLPGWVLGEAKKVHSSSGVLDSDKHVEPLAQDGVDMQEVDRENAASLGGEELSPTRSGPSRCGRQACIEQDGAHG